MTLAAGTLNRRVKLQRPVETQGPDGALVVVWQEAAAVWADIRYLGGIEAIKSGAPASVARASIRIRYRADVQAKWRAVCGPAIFDIEAVLPDAAGREYVDLVCTTGGNEG